MQTPILVLPFLLKEIVDDVWGSLWKSLPHPLSSEKTG